MAARRDALNVVLAEQGVPVGARTELTGHPGVAAFVVAAGREMPASWVDRSAAASPPLTVKPIPTRGSYRHDAGELAIGADGNTARRRTAAAHELGHRMVATTPALQGLSVTHHHVRVDRGRGRDLELIVQLPTRPPGELGQLDHYGLKYCGKVYRMPGDPPGIGVHNGAELLPVGLQALQHGDYGALRGDIGQGGEDPELRHFTLGVLLAVK